MGHVTGAVIEGVCSPTSRALMPACAHARNQISLGTWSSSSARMKLTIAGYLIIQCSILHVSIGMFRVVTSDASKVKTPRVS